MLPFSVLTYKLSTNCPQFVFGICWKCINCIFVYTNLLWDTKWQAAFLHCLHAFVFEIRRQIYALKLVKGWLIKNITMHVKANMCIISNYMLRKGTKYSVHEYDGGFYDDHVTALRIVVNLHHMHVHIYYFNFILHSPPLYESPGAIYIHVYIYIYILQIISDTRTWHPRGPLLQKKHRAGNSVCRARDTCYRTRNY